MSPEDFVTLVRRMRAKQREYSRDRKPSVLNESRDLERRVDNALAEYEAGPDLFATES